MSFCGYRGQVETDKGEKSPEKTKSVILQW